MVSRPLRWLTRGLLLQAQQCLNQLTKRIAPYLEIPILIERGAGGRKQHHRLMSRCSGSVARRGGNRVVQCTSGLVRDGVGQSGGKLIGGLADQIGLANAWEERAQAFDP